MDKCSFCGGDEKLVVQGRSDNTFICKSCAGSVIQYFNSIDLVQHDKENITPRLIKEKLDKYVIGQDETKKVLSVSVYNHLLKIHNNLTDIQKGNILLIGPTGSGKTFLAQTLAKILDIPFVVTDATTLTEAGYVGEDVETILQPLLQKCDFDVEKASMGIVYIDEIDKKARKSSGNPSITRDVSGEGVQYGLLKLIEGTIANIHAVGTRKHPQSSCTQLDTSNILFIFGGAFNGLTQIISNRLGQNEIGFGNTMNIPKSVRDTELLKQVEQDDLIQYGIIPELVGRIPVVTVLNELEVHDLIRILLEPKGNLISQYRTLLSQDGINLNFSDETIGKIAQTAYDKNIGARGLKSVIEKIMLDFMFEVDRNKQGNYDIEF